MLEPALEQKHMAMPDYPYMEIHRKNLSNPPHCHHDMELIPVLSGCVTVYCSVGTVKASAGDIAVLMPGEIHNYSTEDENEVRVIKLHCKNSADGTDLSKYRFAGGLIKSGSELNREVFSHIDKLVEAHRSNKRGAAYEVNAHANMIISLILGSDKCEKQGRSTNRHNESTRAILQKVSEYIASHLTEHISLECIASHCNMSKYYFAHTFKEAMGMTFLEYLTSYRINTAIHLLTKTDKSITRISYLSGFSTTRMFNHLFKTKLGMSPSEYRKKHRQ